MNMNLIRAFGAPHRYYQGPDALSMVGTVARELGSRPLLVADPVVHQLIGPGVSRAIDSAGLPLSALSAAAEVTRDNVAALLSTLDMSDGSPDVVLAAGGGKGIDTGKAVAHALNAKLVVIPTAASNDGPCSRLYVFYDDQHRLQSVERLSRNPDTVLVDTSLLVKAPRSMLVSGIGDAICKLYEGEQAVRAGGLNAFGGRGTLAAGYLRTACDETIRRHSADGLAALDQGAPNEAFECLTEALVLLSGLAFENSGLSIAHSITRGIPLAKGTEKTLHGYHVAYGLLVQWVLEQRAEEFLMDQLRFYRQVGLATSLRELGAEESGPDVLRAVAEGTMSSPHIANFSRRLTTEDVVAAISRVELLAEPRLRQ